MTLDRAHAARATASLLRWALRATAVAAAMLTGSLLAGLGAETAGLIALTGLAALAVVLVAAPACWLMRSGGWFRPRGRRRKVDAGPMWQRAGAVWLALLAALGGAVLVPSLVQAVNPGPLAMAEPGGSLLGAILLVFVAVLAASALWLLAALRTGSGD